MKEIFIHVGAGKTGTSALQEFFFVNRELLKERENISIPEIGSVRYTRSLAHHELSDWGVYKNPNALKLWSEIASCDQARVLITSEVLHSRMSATDGIDFFQSVKQILDGWKIFIIFYIRRQSQWAQSAYNEWIKRRNNFSMPIEKFADTFSLNSLTNQLFRFEKVFGEQNILVRPFEKVQFVGGSLFSDFFNLLNIDISADFKFPENNPNPRLNIEALEFKRMANEISNGRPNRNLLLKELMLYSELAAESDSTNVHHRHNIMPVAVQRRIEDANSDSYRIIAERFLNRTDGQLFVEDIGDPRVQDAEDHRSSIERLYTFLFLEIFQENKKLKRKVDLLTKKLDKG